jgi:hypothetical protein
MIVGASIDIPLAEDLWTSLMELEKSEDMIELFVHLLLDRIA